MRPCCFQQAIKIEAFINTNKNSIFSSTGESEKGGRGLHQCCLEKKEDLGQREGTRGTREGETERRFECGEGKDGREYLYYSEAKQKQNVSGQ